MNDAKLKFGLIGAGGIAQAYLQAFKDYQQVELVAVVDTRIEAAKAMAETTTAEAYDSYLSLSECTDVDAVIICTPPNTHFDVATHFLEKGVHVLCEKPFTIDVESAREMARIAEDNNVLLTMCSKFRFVEDVIKARSIVSSGLLGDLILFENAFTARVDMTQRWNSSPEISGGGVVMDNGTHSVDIMRYFLGPISQVQSIESARVQLTDVEDTALIFAKNHDGVMGTIDLSWSINKELDNYISIYGSAGTIHVGWKESKYRQSSSADWIVFGNGYNKVQAFRSQVENFSNAILGKEALLISLEDAIASVEVISACYASMNNNDWISLSS